MILLIFSSIMTLSCGQGERESKGGPVTLIQGRARFQNNDLVENLVDNRSTYLKKLSEMDERNLQRAQLDEQPWSGYHWPFSSGILGYRYGSAAIDHFAPWHQFHDYVLEHPVSNYLCRGGVHPWPLPF